MAGQYLLHQRGPGTRHPEDEDRAVRRVVRTGQVLPSGGREDLQQLRDVRVMLLPVEADRLGGVARAILLESVIESFEVVQDVTEYEVQPLPA